MWEQAFDIAATECRLKYLFKRAEEFRNELNLSPEFCSLLNPDKSAPEVLCESELNVKEFVKSEEEDDEELVDDGLGGEEEGEEGELAVEEGEEEEGEEEEGDDEVGGEDVDGLVLAADKERVVGAAEVL